MFYQVSPARSQQGTYFSDQFNLGSYDWTPVRGVWTVKEGRYTETVKPDTDISWSAAGSSSWVDYSVEAQVYSPDVSGNFYLAGKWVDENNHYGLEYSADDTGPDSARMTIYKKKNGVRTDLLSVTRSTNPKVPYIGAGAASIPGNLSPAVLKMKFKGSVIELYANDEFLGFTADTSLYFGKIAVGEYNREVYFDEIYVWDVTPPEISSTTDTEVAGTAACIRFNTDEATSYRVDYGVTDSYGSSAAQTLRDTSHSVDLQGLTLNTQYHYRITVTDAAGNQTQSEDRVFTTKAEMDTVAPAVYDISAGNIDANNAVIYWTSDEQANSIVDYGTEPGVYKWSLSYDERTNSHAVYLRKLEGLTTYYFRVKSRDLSGNIAISSQEYSFTTLKDMKPKVTAVLTGSDPEPAGTVNMSVYWLNVPTAVNYKVYVSTSNEWGTPIDISDEAGKTEYSIIRGSLTPYTNYFVRIYAEEGPGGDTDYATVRVFPPGNNPHGYYKSNPDLCGNCHYTHSALGPRLLSEVNADRMCVTCHDGTQSKYDVLRGKIRGPVSEAVYKDSTTGTVYGDIYRATWFDSIAGPYGSVEGSMVQQSVYVPTSRHDLNIYNYAAPGQNFENIETADARLSCSSCHDPHGSENYRNLRPNMNVLNDANPPLINVEAYAVTDSGYERENTVYVEGAVEFCGACHSDFNQGAGSSREAISTTDQPGMKLSNASMHMYMHPVNVSAQYVTKTAYAVPVPVDLPYENGKIICQTCHYTHGTTNTGEHIRRDGFKSTCLKRFNETEGCEACHDKTNHPD